MSWRRRGAPGGFRSCGRCGATRSRSRKAPPAVTMCDVCHLPLCEKHAEWDGDAGMPRIEGGMTGAFKCRQCMQRPEAA